MLVTFELGTSVDRVSHASKHACNKGDCTWVLQSEESQRLDIGRYLVCIFCVYNNADSIWLTMIQLDVWA